jgi:hypothetical protein
LGNRFANSKKFHNWNKSVLSHLLNTLAQFQLSFSELMDQPDQSEPTKFLIRLKQKLHEISIFAVLHFFMNGIFLI